MDVAPPPASRVHLQEVDDRLIVYFRPERSALVFLTVWLAGWTFFGVAAAEQLPKADPGEAAFLLFWLCGWVFGECFVIGVIAWKLFGRKLLAVTSAELTDRKEIGRFAWARSLDASRVRGITTERVPHGEDERPREDFCLRLSYDGEVVRVGEGMGEREADYVASVVLARIRSRSWWSDDDARLHAALASSRPPQPVLEAGRIHVAQPGSREAFLLGGGGIACVMLAGTLLVGVFGQGASQSSAPQAHAQRLPPSRDGFQSPRDYAEAMTLYSLTSGRTKVLGHPRCGARATWTHWSCRVPAKPMLGRLAGRTLRYRCAAVEAYGSGTGVICGPDPPVGLTAPRNAP
jgi:hypothetical protein